MKADPTMEKAVIDAFRQFASGFTDSDIDTIKSAFAPDSDIALIGTGADEKRIGWEEIEKLMVRDWEQSESSSMHIGDYRVSESGSVAWVIADINVKAKAGDENIDLALRATAVLENRSGGWLIQQAHLSAPIQPGF